MTKTDSRLVRSLGFVYFLSINRAIRQLCDVAAFS